MPYALSLSKRFFVLAAFAAYLILPPHAHGAGYHFQTYIAPGAATLGTSIYGINNNGVMVGNFQNTVTNVVDGFVLDRSRRPGLFTNRFIDVAVPTATW